MSAPNTRNCVEHAHKIDQALLAVPIGHPLRGLLETASQLLVAAAVGQIPVEGHDNTRAALIDKGYHWRDIGPDTPRGSKMQLINRPAGVAIYGPIGSHETFFTHWAPLPTFLD